MTNQKISKEIQATISKIADMCVCVEKGQAVDIDAIECQVDALTRDVTTLDLAADTEIKTGLMTLNAMLEKLWEGLKGVHERLVEQMDEINIHQQALHAYARVANHNLHSTTR